MSKRGLKPAIVSGVLAFCLCGCANVPVNETPKAPPATPITLTSQQVKDIEIGVRASLKDPDSAKFSGPVLGAKRANGDIEACGTVNAKNSYGGYVGASPYVATLRDRKVIDSATASGSDARFIIEICRDRGVPL